MTVPHDQHPHGKLRHALTRHQRTIAHLEQQAAELAQEHEAEQAHIQQLIQEAISTPTPGPPDEGPAT
jgi:cell division protein FtsB